MPNTYSLIASSTVGVGGAANITFNSIPSIYTDLTLAISSRSTRNTGIGTSIYVKFNSSGSGYTYRYIYGQASSVVSESQASGTNLTTRGWVGFTNNTNNTASIFGSANLYIPNYAGSNNKSYSSDFVQENNSTTDYLLGFNAGLWSNTAAINSLEITMYQGADFNLVQHSSAYLYGIIKS
jgi:hypothetical protein